MSSTLKAIQADYLLKQKTLELARNTLKTEFFGIDKAINQLITCVRPWYIMNAFQDRPVIINLWGLTGVGKTSIVKRLMTLLDFQDSLWHLDMGKASENNDFPSQLYSDFESKQFEKHEYLAIVLDEFQYARTRDEYEDIFKSREWRWVWELLDTGTLNLKLDKKSWDVSKAVIFVIGNLDEAYQMNNNLTADLNADVFYQATLEINLPQIKQALAQLFKSEQIARLGNTHIIYPALSSKAYQQIIALELEKLEKKLKTKTGIAFKFSPSIASLVYREAVFPTQGARLVFSTINSMIRTHIPVLLTELVIQNLQINEIVLSYKEDKLKAEYFQKSKLIHRKNIQIFTVMEGLRRQKSDDDQAITAVHESGHAILSAILLQVIPEQVCSIATDGYKGFVYSKFPWPFHTKNQIKNRVAMYLGGFVAEELIFGNDYRTSGSSSDIRKVTTFLTNMYKLSGLADLPVTYRSDLSENPFIHDCAAIEDVMKSTVEESLELAKKTLKREMKLLLIMANYLSDYPKMDKAELKVMITKYQVSQVEFIEDGTDLYYRKRIKLKFMEHQQQEDEALCLSEKVEVL